MQLHPLYPRTGWGEWLVSRSGRFTPTKEPTLSIHLEAQWASELVSMVQKRERSITFIGTRILNSKSYGMTVMTIVMLFLNMFFTVIPQFIVIGVHLSVYYTHLNNSFFINIIYPVQ